MNGVLGFVVCGAPLASRAADVAAALVAVGWTLQVRVSPAGADWIDLDVLAEAAEAPVQVRRRRPDEPRPPRPERVVAFPLTFSTANKAANGIMDTGPSGMLCDCLAQTIPVLAAHMVSQRLWGHPAWKSTSRLLADNGFQFLDAQTGLVGPPTTWESSPPGSLVSEFDPSWIVQGLRLR